MKDKLRKVWIVMSLALVVSIAPLVVYWGLSDLALDELMKSIWGIYAPIVFFIFGFLVGFKFITKIMLSEKAGFE